MAAKGVLTTDLQVIAKILHKDFYREFDSKCIGIAQSASASASFFYKLISVDVEGGFTRKEKECYFKLPSEGRQRLKRMLRISVGSMASEIKVKGVMVWFATPKTPFSARYTILSTQHTIDGKQVTFFPVHEKILQDTYAIEEIGQHFKAGEYESLFQRAIGVLRSINIGDSTVTASSPYGAHIQECEKDKACTISHADVNDQTSTGSIGDSKSSKDLQDKKECTGCKSQVTACSNAGLDNCKDYCADVANCL